jgi:hypothetical protein
MINRIITATLLLAAFAAKGQVTKAGSDTLIDVACWNTEWFGDAGNGPGDEALQYTNIKAVISGTDLDVWGLAEVSSASTFNSLLTDLPAYDGLTSSFSQTQKTAMMWKKSLFNLVSYGNVLTQQTYNYDFAGRPPLEVVLSLKDTASGDTLYFYVLHMKANSGNADQTSYNRRKNAAGYLKTFLDQNRKGKKVLVIGDWNDDIDESVVRISGSYLETPYANFVGDSPSWYFPTFPLTLAGERSYVYGSQMIDHQMIDKGLKDSFYVANSATVLSRLSSQISNYGNNTSDHYPVITSYNFKRYPKPVPVGINELPGYDQVSVYPNPASTVLYTGVEDHHVSLELITVTGEVAARSNASFMDVSGMAEGFYLLKITGERGAAFQKIMIRH